MYERVYWHHINRAMTAMVKYGITRLLKRQNSFSIPSFIGDTFFLSQGEALGRLFQYFNRAKLADEINPIGHLVQGERGIYKAALEFNTLEDSEFAALGRALSRNSLEKISEIEDALASQLSRHPRLTSLQIRPGEVVIDVPVKHRENVGGERGGQIFVYEGKSYGLGEPLEEATDLISRINLLNESRNRICRVYVAPRVAESGTMKVIAGIIRSVLESELDSGQSQS
jgi:HD superfamily phosphohydrolase